MGENTFLVANSAMAHVLGLLLPFAISGCAVPATTAGDPNSSRGVGKLETNHPAAVESEPQIAGGPGRGEARGDSDFCPAGLVITSSDGSKLEGTGASDGPGVCYVTRSDGILTPTAEYLFYQQFTPLNKIFAGKMIAFLQSNATDLQFDVSTAEGKVHMRLKLVSAEPISRHGHQYPGKTVEVDQGQASGSGMGGLYRSFNVAYVNDGRAFIPVAIAENGVRAQQSTITRKSDFYYN